MSTAFASFTQRGCKFCGDMINTQRPFTLYGDEAWHITCQKNKLPADGTDMKRAYARFCRCIYILLIGMWQGECAVDFRNDQNRTTLIGSGIERAPGVYKPLHVWWSAESRSEQT